MLRAAHFVVALSLLGGLACGGDPPRSAEPSLVPPAPAPETQEPREPAAAVDAPREPDAAAQARGPAAVDLLASVETQVAVSSAYRDSPRQVPRLFDGDLGTAWNSRSGDLVGAYIEVRVPSAVTVTAIEMTAGFTRTSESGEDLFTGNHRVRRVRVSRDGQAIGEHALDTDSREVTSLPVTGPGGTYRVEVLEVLPGARTDWREVCVSELRVMGHAPGATAGAGFPRYAIGALPDPRAEATPSRAELRGALRRRLTWFVDEWIRYERALMQTQLNTGDPEVSREEAGDFRRRRAHALGRLASLVDSVDGAASAPLRRAAALAPTAPPPRDPWRWPLRWRDILPAEDAVDRVLDWLGDEGARCHANRALARLRLSRVRTMVEWEREAGEWEEMQAMEVGEELDDARDIDALIEVRDLLDDALFDWPGAARALAGQLRAHGLPRSDAQEDWEAALVRLDLAERHCR